MTREILIASFVFKDRLDYFLNYLKNEFSIEKKSVFIYENESDENQYIFTFYLEIHNGDKINLKDFFNSAIIVHKKMGVFYTINGLNKLIEVDSDVEAGNINYKEYQIDWKKYRNKIILNSDNNLLLIPIKRFFY